MSTRSTSQVSSLDPAILSGAAGPLDAPLQGRPLQGRPLQGRPLQGRPLQGRPLQGRPLQGRFLTDPPPSAFAFAPFQALVNHPIVDPPLITQIGLDVAGGWPAQLQGYTLGNLPPQEINLNDVITNAQTVAGLTVWDHVKNITLDHFDLTQTALGNLPPVAELAGSAKLTDLAPASNWTDTGGWLDTMSPVCTTPVSGFDPTQKTLVDLALARCPLTVVPWETLRIQDFNLTATNSLLYSYGMLGVDPTSIPVQYGTDPQTTLGALTLDDVPTGIVDCSLLACTSAHTLGRGVRPHAELARLRVPSERDLHEVPDGWYRTVGRRHRRRPDREHDGRAVPAGRHRAAGLPVRAADDRTAARRGTAGRRTARSRTRCPSTSRARRRPARRSASRCRAVASASSRDPRTSTSARR